MATALRCLVWCCWSRHLEHINPSESRHPTGFHSKSVLAHSVHAAMPTSAETMTVSSPMGVCLSSRRQELEKETKFPPSGRLVRQSSEATDQSGFKSETEQTKRRGGHTGSRQRQVHDKTSTQAWSLVVAKQTQAEWRSLIEVYGVRH